MIIWPKNVRAPKGLVEKIKETRQQNLSRSNPAKGDAPYRQPQERKKRKNLEKETRRRYPVRLRTGGRTYSRIARRSANPGGTGYLL